MKSRKRVTLRHFIILIILLVIIIISFIFAMVSHSNISVLKSTEEHAVEDMQKNSEDYAKIISFAMENGITDLEHLLNSDAFTFRIVFVTDTEGRILAKSNLAKYTISEDDIFSCFQDFEYLDGTSEKDVRALLKSSAGGTYAIRRSQKETIVFCPIGDSEFRLFYMMHQGDVERIYTESEKYIKTVKNMGIAYIIATVGLVVLMGAYIVSAIKASEVKLYLSSLRFQNAQKQVRTYSDITRVLSQSYERVYYVNLSDDEYIEFSSSAADQKLPVWKKGKDFWNAVCGPVSENTVEEDRESVRLFLNRENLPENAQHEDSRSLRFRMSVKGKPVYFYAKAYISESEGQQYLILGVKNVDSAVSHDMKQIAEKEAALRRVEIYRSALLDNMLAYVEVNLNRDTVDDGPYIVDDNSKMQEVDLSVLGTPIRFDDLAAMCLRQLYVKDPGEFLRKNSCSHLKEEFEAGHRFVETNYSSKWFDGSVRELRLNYYMSKRNEDGSIIALCVLYDMTEKVSRDREIENLTDQLNRTRIKISTSQMQPHFLYNVLGSIREIILEDPEYASDLICDFTTHLRACIKSMSTDELVSFSKEVENIKAYVNIEKMRFGDRMAVEFDIREEDFDVVPLSIQPLVENAIRHGLYPKKENGRVKISSFSQNGFKVVVVNDNGVGFDYGKVIQEIKEGRRDSTGILNLTLRLEKIMNAKVYFDSRIGEGTTVTVLIPDRKEG